MNTCLCSPWRCKQSHRSGLQRIPHTQRLILGASYVVCVSLCRLLILKMCYYSVSNWTYEGVCGLGLAHSFSLRCWPFQVHSLEPQSGMVARLCLVRLWQEHKQTCSPVCLQVVCPLSHSSKTTTTNSPKTMRGWHGYGPRSASLKLVISA